MKKKIDADWEMVAEQARLSGHSAREVEKAIKESSAGMIMLILTRSGATDLPFYSASLSAIAASLRAFECRAEGPDDKESHWAATVAFMKALNVWDENDEAQERADFEDAWRMRQERKEEGIKAAMEKLWPDKGDERVH